MRAADRGRSGRSWNDLTLNHRRSIRHLGMRVRRFSKMCKPLPTPCKPGKIGASSRITSGTHPPEANSNVTGMSPWHEADMPSKKRQQKHPCVGGLEEYTKQRSQRRCLSTAKISLPSFTRPASRSGHGYARLDSVRWADIHGYSGFHLRGIEYHASSHTDGCITRVDHTSVTRLRLSVPKGGGCQAGRHRFTIRRRASR